MTALIVHAAGPGVTIQDEGRHGYLRYGVTAAGPMDPPALATANRALGNSPGAAAIEVSLGGLELSAVDGPVAVAIAGGAFKVGLDGRDLPAAVAVPLEPDARLTIRPGAAGAWCYVAVAGRIDLAPALGSLATHTRSGIGGLQGRALTAGDIIPIATTRAVNAPAAAIEAPWLDRPGDVIRVVLGPQDDYFAPDQIAAFLVGLWTLSGRSDRMAYQLDGPTIAHAKGFNIVSDGVTLGAIQVPGHGRPIVLMADRQSTGGYPKIAAVIGTDFGKLAQLRPGARFGFAAVSVEEAVKARRVQADFLAKPPVLRPLRRTEFPSEYLLGVNLIDGAVAEVNEL